MDGGAGGAVVEPQPPQSGPYLVAQGAVPHRTRSIRGRAAYGKAVELLLQVRFDLWQIGGSHAQRDVVNWTLTEAAIRAGQRDVALSLAHERLGARPRSAPNRSFLRRAEQMAA